MKNKILSLAIITAFAISMIPMTVSAAQPINEMKLSFEIDSETISMFSDLANVLSDRPDNNPITAAAKPDKPGKPAPDPESYELTIEIDYIEGHMPTQTVLDYITLYYAKENIELTFVIDDPIPDADIYDNGISYEEFLTIEAEYNEGADKIVDRVPTLELTTLKEKWVLYGTSVENEEDTVGYTLCWGTSRDLIAGNWMYIADGRCDSLAGEDLNLQMGIEAVVLMHEFGHSIGICTVRLGSEIYCSNYYCVMSYLRPQNAGNIDKWYYCDKHWKTKNLDYYIV